MHIFLTVMVPDRCPESGEAQGIVGDHGSFRKACRPSSVLQESQLALHILNKGGRPCTPKLFKKARKLYCSGERTSWFPCFRRQGEDRSCRHVIEERGQKDMLQGESIPDFFQFGIKSVDSDHDFGFGIPDLILQLNMLKHGVERNDHPARSVNREVPHSKLGATAPLS